MMAKKKYKVRRGGFAKTVRERDASGALIPKIDFGTDENRARRMALVMGKDPVLAQSPMGVLVAKGFIDASVWKSVERYAAAKRIRFGTGLPAKVDLLSPGPSYDNSGDERERGAKVLLGQTDDVFRRRPPYHRSIFDDVAVFQKWPDWIYQSYPWPGAIPDLAAIIEIATEIDVALRRMKRALPVSGIGDAASGMPAQSKPESPSPQPTTS